MKYKHVAMSLPEMARLCNASGAPPETPIIDWWLNKNAPGKLIGATAFVQPIKLSPLDPQPVMAPVFHFFFELREVHAS